MDFDVAYYEYYDYQEVNHVVFSVPSGETRDCTYYYFTPFDAEIDEETPVIVYVTHGGGVVEEERALALSWGASLDTEAIFIVPWTDRDDGICAALEDARERLGGKGNFDAISIHGTSSGGRAIMMAALKSVEAGSEYSFRFQNVCAYDPAAESEFLHFRERPEELAALAAQGTVLFLQTDRDHSGNHGGSGLICNGFAKAYSEHGGTALVAEVENADHAGKFIKPLSHNSLNWSIGKGELREDESYQNDWFIYLDGEKLPISLEEATEIMQAE